MTPPIEALPEVVFRAVVGDLIRYERESTTLDFKRTTYAKQDRDELVRDILAMANAHAIGDRYIICGVHAPPNGDRTLLGVPRETFADAAAYQQLVHQNIEPDLHLDYFPYEMDGLLFGVFRIASCAERPYAMRKQLGNELLQGHMWIRKGTTKLPVRREDLERIYAERYGTRGFTGPVHIGWDAEGTPIRLVLPVARDVELPSMRAAREMRAVLQAREAQEQKWAAQQEADIQAGRMTREMAALFAPSPFANIRIHPPGSFVPYEDRLTATLRRDLDNIAQTHARPDARAVFEEMASPINLILRNEGTEHIEAARIEVDLLLLPGLVVVDSPPPSKYDLLAGGSSDGYPRVTIGDRRAQVVAEIGDLRHHVPTKVFDEPLRVVLGVPLAGTTLAVQVRLHGRNLPKPILAQLELIVEPLPAPPASGQRSKRR